MSRDWTPKESYYDMSSIQLEARLGINFMVSPAELEILRGDDYEASQALLLQIIASDRCMLGGDTYLPGPWNEDYLDDDVNFELPERPLHSNPQMSLNDRIKDAESRALSQQPSQDHSMKSPER